MSSGYTFLLSANLNDAATANSGSDLKTMLNNWVVNLNGNIGTPNLETASVTDIKIADSVNPRLRHGEVFPACKTTGLIFTTGTDTSAISAGVLYASGYRISYSAAGITKAWAGNESKDVYLFIRGSDGNIQYTAVSVGANQPNAPSSAYTPVNFTTIGASSTATICYNLLQTQLNNTDYKDYRYRLNLRGHAYYYILAGAGEITLPNSGSTAFSRKRITTATTTITSSKLDAGTTWTASKWYFIYLHSNSSSESDYSFTVSTASSAASVVGIKTYRRKIGWFRTDASATTSILAQSVGWPGLHIGVVGFGTASITTSTYTTFTAGDSGLPAQLYFYKSDSSLGAVDSGYYEISGYIQTTATSTTAYIRSNNATSYPILANNGDNAVSYLPFSCRGYLATTIGKQTASFSAKSNNGSANPIYIKGGMIKYSVEL